MCTSRKNPCHPTGGHWKFPGGGGGGGGVLKLKILEAKYDAKLEFPEVMWVQNKKPSVGGVRIFSGTAQYYLSILNPNFLCTSP